MPFDKLSDKPRQVGAIESLDERSIIGQDERENLGIMLSHLTPKEAL
ncbi:MAG: hypothetical protein ACE5JL_05115 [Dehalococcoidia bacterium]